VIGRLPLPDEIVDRAAYALAAAVEHVRVDHRRAHVFVAEQLLDRAYVVAVFEQVGRERVAQRVAGGVFVDP
jgi:hypothetical protein